MWIRKRDGVQDRQIREMWMAHGGWSTVIRTRSSVRLKKGGAASPALLQPDAAPGSDELEVEVWKGVCIGLGISGGSFHICFGQQRQVWGVVYLAGIGSVGREDLDWEEETEGEAERKWKMAG